LGLITAIGGEIIGDFLSGRRTLLMTDEIYAVPVVLGCLVMLFTYNFFPECKSQGLLTSTVIAFTMHAAAIHWSLRLPAWFNIRHRE
jgi:uncharacterized membrane protein YeiH